MLPLGSHGVMAIASHGDTVPTEDDPQCAGDDGTAATEAQTKSHNR
jgi:hypothetical protein